MGKTSDRGNNGYTYQAIFSVWAVRDLDAAVQAYEKLPRNESTVDVIGNLASFYAFQRPDEAYQ